MKFKKTIIAFSTTAGLLFAGGLTASAAENNSIVDYLYTRGEDYSFSNRSQLASQHGVAGYKGTAYQNITLLNKLRGNAPAIVKEEVKAPVQPEPKQAQSNVPQGRTMTVEATAYGANCAGCSGITATGLNVKANPDARIIAVDPNVIPLGSKVYIEGYGTYTAADTGGSIKGNRIDVFMGSEANATSFGRQHLKLTILN